MRANRKYTLSVFYPEFFPTVDELEHMTAIAWGQSGIRALLEGRMSDILDSPSIEHEYHPPVREASRVRIDSLAKELKLAPQTVRFMLETNNWTLEQASIELTKMLNKGN